MKYTVFLQFGKDDPKRFKVVVQANSESEAMSEVRKLIKIVKIELEKPANIHGVFGDIFSNFNEIFKNAK
jgi:hypothetical protein